MAKKIRTVLTLQLPAGAATPAPPVGTALGPHGINIVEFCKTLQREDAGQARPDHPGPDHDLRGSQLHLHPQDAARGRPAAQGGGRREGRVRRPVARRSARSRAARSARSPRSRWPTSTRSTSTAPPRSSRAPRARWASRSSAKPTQPNRRQRAGRTPRGTEGRPERGRQKGEFQDGLIEARSTSTARRSSSAARLRARRGDGPAQADLVRRLRRVGRGAHPPRRRPAPRRPDGARHGRAAARHGQEDPRDRLRPGREGAGSAARPAPTRSVARTWPRGSRPAGSTSTSPSRRPT